MDLVEQLIKLLKEKHGKDLDLSKDVYYLFLKGGVFSLYYDEEGKSLKVDVELLPEDSTFVYFSDKEIEKIL